MVMRVMRSLITATLLLSGCALLEPQGSDAVDRVIADALATARAPAAEQKAALGAAQAAFERDTTARSRLRLATLLAVVQPPLRDDARAGELLEPLANPSSAGDGRLPALLAAPLRGGQA